MADPTTPELPADGELPEDMLNEVAGGLGLNSGLLGSTNSSGNSGTMSAGS